METMKFKWLLILNFCHNCQKLINCDLAISKYIQFRFSEALSGIFLLLNLRSIKRLGKHRKQTLAKYFRRLKLVSPTQTIICIVIEKNHYWKFESSILISFNDLVLFEIYIYIFFFTKF